MNELIVIEQKSVDFNGAELMAVKCNDGKIYAGVKWFCNGLGFNENQQRGQRIKLGEDAVLSKGVRKISLPTKGGNQAVLCIELDFLPLWLAKINVNIIEDPFVQERLIDFQLRAKDVLAEAFVAPRADIPAEIMKDPIMAMRYEQIKMEQRLSSIEAEQDDIRVQTATAQEQAELAHERINALDTIDPNGTPRQQLIKLVNRYSEKNGLMYPEGWRKFREAYNIAGHTNVKMLANNYARKYGIRKMTIPEYLEVVGKIQDGLRVADKMLHPANEYAATI